MPDPRFAPSIMRTENTAKIREGYGESLIERVCKPVQGGKSGEGKNPSHLKIRAIDDQNNLPDKNADGAELELVKEALKGKGPFTEKETLQIVFFRKNGSADWKPRINARTEDPKEVVEWLKRVQA